MIFLATDVSSNNANFIKDTPITSVFIPADQIDTTRGPQFKGGSLLGRVIVYWVNTYNNDTVLYRSHADVDSKSSTIHFSTPALATSDAIQVQVKAQIGFVLDKKEQANKLYVSKVGEEGISQITDSWLPDSDSGKSAKDETTA